MSTAKAMLEQVGRLENAREAKLWAKKRTRSIAQLNGDAGAIYEALQAKGLSDSELMDLQDAVTQKASTMNVTKRIGDDLAKWGYSFWLNDMDDSIWNGDQRWTDIDAAILRMKARDAGYAELKLLSAMDDAIPAIAARNRRHPIRDYLNGLRWDDKDHIAALARYIEDSHELVTYEDGTNRTVFHAFLRRWLVGAVAKMFGDENAARSNFVLVLAGAQDAGKSHFANWLCPLPGYFNEGNVNPDDKDGRLRRAKTWVWELGEIGATTRRADVEALKQFITATTVTDRAPYGHFDVSKPAVASYMGTVNPDGAGFLQDPTGNRRFAVVDIASVAWDYATNIDVAQVWAQATALWRQEPTSYRLSMNETAVQRTNADTHMDVDVFADMLERTYYIDKTKGVADGWTATSSQILDALRTYAGLSRGHDKVQGRDLARSLKRQWGIDKRRSGGATVYDGLKLRASG